MLLIKNQIVLFKHEDTAKLGRVISKLVGSDDVYVIVSNGAELLIKSSAILETE